MPTLVLRHSFAYETEPELPVWQVAEALLALEGIIRRSPPILEQIFEGTTIEQVQVFMDKVEAGSLYEDIVVKLMFGSQERLDAGLAKTRRTLRLDQIAQNKLLAVVILALILEGGRHALSLFVDHAPARAQIEANNNTIITIGAEATGMLPAELKQLIETSIKDPKRLANESIRVLRPAKGTPNGKLEIDLNPGLAITPDTIRAIPSQIFPDEPQEFLKDFDILKIEIRATDLDSFKRGWGVKIPQLSTRRIPMQVDPTVDLGELQSGRTITGAATITFQLDEQGSQQPKHVYLRSIAKVRRQSGARQE